MITSRRSLRAARLETARLRTALAEAARREEYQALLARAIRNSHAISTPAHATK